MSSFLLKSTLFVVISEIIFNISGFVIHSAVGRILGPADYGRYALVITLTTMVIILIGNGIPTAMSKYLSEVFETKTTLIKIIKRQAIILQSVVIGAITILFFLSAPLIAKILGDPTLTRLFRISTLIIPSFAAASFYFSYYTGLHRFGIQSTLKIFRSILKVIFIITLAYFFRVEGSVIGYIAAPLIVFLIAYGIDKFKIAREKREIAADASFPHNDITFDWKKLLNYAWQIVIFFLAYELLISIDLYLVKGILKDDFQTGIYNASLTIGRIPYYLFYALTVVLLPVISKTTSQNGKEETSRIISRTLRFMIVFLAPSIILMSAFAKPIINLFYGDIYSSAAIPMSILVWGVGFLTIFYVFCFVMSGANKVKKPMILSIIGLAINTILNYFFIKNYGIVGSAIATSITSILITLIMLYFIWKDFGVKIKILSFLKIISAGIIMYAVSLFLVRGPIIFILWSFLLFALYLLILYIIGEIKKEDISYFTNLLKKNKSNII